MAYSRHLQCRLQDVHKSAVLDTAPTMAYTVCSVNRLPQLHSNGTAWPMVPGNAPELTCPIISLEGRLQHTV